MARQRLQPTTRLQRRRGRSTRPGSSGRWWRHRLATADPPPHSNSKNDFTSGSNKNARADRSNVVFMSSMAENAPMDYGADPSSTAGSDFATRLAAAKAAIDGQVPCDVSNDPDCFGSVARLAYLNQQRCAHAWGRSWGGQEAMDSPTTSGPTFVPSPTVTAVACR